MARPGQTESESVSIWLKLSEADAEQLRQVLSRPEFAGWTKAEWCLEIIQTALRYYAKRPVADPGRTRAPAQLTATEPSPPAPAPAPAPEPAASRPERAAPKRKPATPQPRRAAPKRKPAAPRPERTAPEPEPVPPEPARADPEAERAGPESDPTRAGPEPEPTRVGLGPGRAEPEPARAGLEAEPVAAAQPSPSEAECPHPADARDYQTGTCAACGAILWD
jgi:hypothetical protein